MIQGLRAFPEDALILSLIEFDVYICRRFLIFLPHFLMDLRSFYLRHSNSLQDNVITFVDAQT